MMPVTVTFGKGEVWLHALLANMRVQTRFKGFPHLAPYREGPRAGTLKGVGGLLSGRQALNETQGSPSSMSLPEFCPNPNQNAFNDFLMNQSVTQTALFKSKRSFSARPTVPPAVFSLPKLANAAAEQLNRQHLATSS